MKQIFDIMSSKRPQTNKPDITVRVHICTVGFDFDRIVKPIIDYKAERVHLISNFSSHDQASAFKRLIHNKLAQHNIPFIQHEADIFDFYSMLSIFHSIIQSEKGHEIYINVGSGTKISAIAGALAGTMWGATIYYPQIEYHTPHGELEVVHIPDQNVLGYINLPEFKIHLPTEEQLLALQFIYKIVQKEQIEIMNETGKQIDLTTVAISKNELFKRLIQEALNSPNIAKILSDGGLDVIKENINLENISTRYYNWLNRSILTPLAEGKRKDEKKRGWEYIIHGKHKIKLTKSGIDFAKIITKE